MKTSGLLSLVRKNDTAAGSAQGKFRLRLKLSRIAGVLFCSGSLSIVSAAPLSGQPDSPADGATVRGGQVYCLRGTQLEVLTNVLKLPFDVEVRTNATFKVGEGKERTLEEGQVIRSDGWLMNPDGAVEPVYDHVGMKDGAVVVVRDGQAEPVTTTMTFPSGLVIAPDGWCQYPSGNRARLADGQLFRLDGASVGVRDTATLKNGLVVLQKDGKLISRLPTQITGMCDGTRVRWDGVILYPDGTTTTLQEGQTILLEGRASRH